MSFRIFYLLPGRIGIRTAPAGGRSNRSRTRIRRRNRVLTAVRNREGSGHSADTKSLLRNRLLDLRTRPFCARFVPVHAIHWVSCREHLADRKRARLSSAERVESMKAHLTERSVKGLQPQPKNVIVYDEEVVGFGVRITSGGIGAFILTYRIEAWEQSGAANPRRCGRTASAKSCVRCST
jgi:hypothetical protein